MISNNQDILSKAEFVYFQCSFQLQHRLPVFYGLPKVHKSPISLCHVVSNTNSFLAVFSIWLDQKMKDLLPLIKSYIKNSSAVISDLNELILPGSKDLYRRRYIYVQEYRYRHRTARRWRFLSHTSTQTPRAISNKFFLEILEAVMRNNIFTFGETYWVQKRGTAMGTPMACTYATLTYGHYENTMLVYFHWYINDILGIWVPHRNNPNRAWKNFNIQLNNWDTLKRKVEEPSVHTTFLDLNINISNSAIKFSTLQKPLSLYLYLYLPPLSAHPLSCLKGQIKWEMKRWEFWKHHYLIHQMPMRMRPFPQ